MTNPRPNARAWHRFAPWALPALIALLLAAGAVYAGLLGARLRYPDEQEYVTLARHLADLGRYTLDGQQPTAYRPPGYPVILAMLTKAGGGVVSFRLLNMAALAAAVLLLHRLTRAAGGERAALLAAAIAAAYPLSFYTAGTLYPQTIAGAGLLLALYLHGPDGPANPARAIGCGLLMGALVLCVPTMAIALATLAAWTLWRSRGRAWMRVGLLGAAALLVLAPWALRNQRVFHAWVAVSTNGGINLLLGNSEHTTPDAGVNVDIDAYLRSTEGMTEVEQDRALAEAAVAWMKADPARAARLYLAKALHAFAVRDTLRVSTEGRAWQAWVVAASYWPLLAAVGLRLLTARRRPWSGMEKLALLLYLTQAAFQALYFTRLRFRVPLDPLLMIPAAIALAQAWRPARPPAEPAAPS